jgi:hypothetical protein
LQLEAFIKEAPMPDRQTTQRARRDMRQGKAPSTAAGEFIREEMHHVREGKHGARSTRQAIAIGMSKARRAGVPLKPLKGRQASASAGGKRRQRPSSTRSRAVRGALEREGHSAASRKAISRQARSAAQRRGHTARSRAAKKAAQTRRRRS